MALLTGRNRISPFAGADLLAGVAITAVWATGSRSAIGARFRCETAAPTESGAGSGVAYDGPSGIWASGTGRASAAADIAVISLGVESIEPTAAEARSEAATAMSGVMSVLTNAGVSLSDIQTSRFNISPRYQSVEVQRCDEADDAKGDDHDRVGRQR